MSARTAHRMVGYLAEASVHGYLDYLDRIRAGDLDNCPAPAAAVAYWNLPAGARLGDMVGAVVADEAIYRDIHHAFADALAEGDVFPKVSGAAIGSTHL